MDESSAVAFIELPHSLLSLSLPAPIIHTIRINQYQWWWWSCEIHKSVTIIGHPWTLSPNWQQVGWMDNVAIRFAKETHTPSMLQLHTQCPSQAAAAREKSPASRLNASLVSAQETEWKLEGVSFTLSLSACEQRRVTMAHHGSNYIRSGASNDPTLTNLSTKKPTSWIIVPWPQTCSTQDRHYGNFGNSEEKTWVLGPWYYYWRSLNRRIMYEE